MSLPGCFTSIVREHFSVLLPDGNEELINGHGRVYGDLAPEQRFYVMLLMQRTENISTRR